MAASARGQIPVNNLDPLLFPFEGSRLIEASAGTGKTFTIALLYLRLILGHGCTPLMPPQILVTTFTEAAADELRARIRTRLADAARVFSAGDGSHADAHLAALSQAYTEPAARQQAAFRLIQAANWMDEAAIFTIHGWCQRMLTSHAFHSRALFEQTVLTSLAPLIAEAVQDYWRIHVYALPEAQAALAARCLGNPMALVRQLKSLLQRDGTAIWVDGFEVSPAGLDFFTLISGLHKAAQAVLDAEAQARLAWRNGRDALIEGWVPLLGFLNKQSHKPLLERADFTALWPSLDTWAAEQAPLLADEFKFLTAPRFNQKKQRPEHPALAAFSAWALAIEAADQGERAMRLGLLAHAAYWVRDRLNAVLAQRAEMGFDDILLNFAEALQGTSGAQLVASLRAQYPVAMIDEFQDTDPLQFAIFDRVFQITVPALDDSALDDSALADSAAQTDAKAAAATGLAAQAPRSTVVLIGDPKQSIYRFRGADIKSYLAAREATQGRHYTLRDNYRATPALVAAVNYLFSLAEARPRGAFGYQSPDDALAENPLPFVAVGAKGNARPLKVFETPNIDAHINTLSHNLADGALAHTHEPLPVPVPVSVGATVPALTAWVLPATDSLSKEAFELLMAEHTATAIAQQLNLGQAGQCVFSGVSGVAQPIAPRDIAVLVPKGTQAALVQRALNQRGIKSVYLSDRQNVFASPEAADVLRWLGAMAEPHRLSLVRAALGSATLQRSMAELDALREDDALDEAIARFVRYGEIWQTLGVLAAIYQLLHDYAVPAALLAAPFGQSSGERRLTNVLHLADWAQTEQAELAGRDALLQRLTQAMTTAQEAEHELRLEQDAHLVRILTIHSAKGLQFPVVYLPFLALIQSEQSRNKPVATPWHIEVDLAANVAAADGFAKFDRNWRDSVNTVMSLGDFPAALAAEKSERHAEGLRLIYVALTRAESACTIALGPVKFGNVKTPNQAETPLGYLLGLEEKEAFAGSFVAAQAALAACPMIHVAAPPPINLTPYAEPMPQTLYPARRVQNRRRRDWRMTSFSGLTAHLHAGQAPQTLPPAPETAAQDRRPDALVEGALWQAYERAAELIGVGSNEAGSNEAGLTENQLNLAGLTSTLAASSLAPAFAQLPRGTEFGTQLHRLFELAGAAGFAQFATYSACFALVCEVNKTAVSPLPSAHEASLAALVQHVLCLPLWATDARAPISLVALTRYQIELEFWLPVPQMPIAALDALLCAHILPQQARPALVPQTLIGQIKGFMDLVFEADGRFYVLDYKSNWLGDAADAYAPDRLAHALLTARYDLQMLLYLAALHRHLIDRLPDYDPALHLGGAFYVFVRGVDSPGAGVYFMRPDRGVMAAFDALLQDFDASDASQRAPV